jgi:OOP family OmpA-OmpF porin
MNRKMLSAVIALTLGGVTTAHAQTFDDRWYVAPTVGIYKSDSDRLADNNSLLLGIGLGRYLSPNTSIDIFFDRVHRETTGLGQLVLGPVDASAARSWMVGTSLRFYFGDTSGFAPYVMAGVGAIRHMNGVESGWDAGVQAGFGLQNSFTDNVKLRAELAYRYDWDDGSLGGSRPLRATVPGRDFRTEKFGDWFFSLGVTMAIGEPPAPPPPPAPAPVAPPPAPVEPPPAAPEEIVIDLQGVMFEFDRPRPGQERSTANAGLLPGSMEILDQAVEVLNRYPNIRVEVGGHTDSIGSEDYNQKLSERRARVVYDYLVSRGISSDRLVGPVGYGELRPIDTNDTREGRQRNRRTELVRQ